MDLSAISAWLAAALPFPWGIIAGAAVVILYQYAKVRFPDLLTWFPHLVPLPAPSPSPDPVLPANPPVAAPSHPLLEAILKKLFGDGAPAPTAVDPAFLGKLKAEVDSLVRA